jgi:periplasmic protein TonB
MSRNSIIALLVSILLHGGVAASGLFFKKSAGNAAPAAPEVPTIALDMPPPPEPEEPEVTEDAPIEAPTEIADMAPPMQNDVPSAVIDSPFVQQLQAPIPQGLSRPVGNPTIPTNTRPAVGGGKPLGTIFDISSLDQRPEARVRIKPVYPFEMRRSGVKGEVTVGFVVDSNGDVRDPYIIKSSSAGFEQAAIDAVLKWKFKPGKKGGTAVNTRVAQPLSFSLNTE